MVAAQAAAAFRAGLLMRHAAFDVFKIAFALGCLALFGVDAPARGTDIQMRRRNFHIGANFMVEAELFVDVGCRDLSYALRPFRC